MTSTLIVLSVRRKKITPPIVEPTPCAQTYDEGESSEFDEFDFDKQPPPSQRKARAPQPKSTISKKESDPDDARSTNPVAMSKVMATSRLSGHRIRSLLYEAYDCAVDTGFYKWCANSCHLDTMLWCLLLTFIALGEKYLTEVETKKERSVVDLLCTKRVVRGKVVDVNNLRDCFMADLMGQEYGQVRDLVDNVDQLLTQSESMDNDAAHECGRRTSVCLEYVYSQDIKRVCTCSGRSTHRRFCVFNISATVRAFNRMRRCSNTADAFLSTLLADVGQTRRCRLSKVGGGQCKGEYTMKLKDASFGPLLMLGITGQSMDISDEIRIPLLGEEGDMIAYYRLTGIAFYGGDHYYGRACEFLSDETPNWTEYNDLTGHTKDGYAMVKGLGNVGAGEDVLPGYNARLLFYARKGGQTETTQVNVDTLVNYVRAVS